MKRLQKLEHQFVEFIPDRVEEGKLYVSIKFATAMHKCCCGCGLDVITPITPTDWLLIFDGETVSLDPSIGNWSFPCRSHYWIDRNRIMWAEDMPDYKIRRGRQRDRENKDRFFDRQPSQAVQKPTGEEQPHPSKPHRSSIWDWFRNKG